ncbi:MAG: hypothetical protein AB1568_09890 [Thermodesulfobacteriota bacterium]
MKLLDKMFAIAGVVAAFSFFFKYSSYFFGVDKYALRAFGWSGAIFSETYAQVCLGVVIFSFCWTIISFFQNIKYKQDVK